MNDQEKSNFLKAKLLAEKSKEVNTSNPDEPASVSLGIKTITKFIVYFIYFLAIYGSQCILFDRMAIVPFSFVESGILFYAIAKTVSMFGRFFLALRK